MTRRFERIISADSHVREPEDLYWGPLSSKFGDRAPRVLDEYRGEKGKFFFNGKFVTKLIDRSTEDPAYRYKFDPRVNYDSDVRVKYQQDAGVDAEVLNPGYLMGMMGGNYEPGQHEVVQACASVYNDWLAEFCSDSPQSLLGVGTIPMTDIDWAIQELKRIAQKGLKTASINVEPPVGFPPYRHPSYDPFWATAQDLGIPLTLHIIAGRAPDPFSLETPEERENGPRIYMDLCYELIGVLANEFIFGTILDRFPKLKVVCGEFEVSWLPNYMVRLDDVQRRGHRMDAPELKLKASDYIRHRTWHGYVDDPYALHAIEHVGADAIMWGSDFPHSRAVLIYELEAGISEALTGLPLEQQKKIVCGAAERAFGV